MKFTCKPGEQFVIRREAYRRAKEALEARGIYFAHREVKVALPRELEEKLISGNSDELSAPITLQKAAGAAIGSIIGSEIKKIKITILMRKILSDIYLIAGIERCLLP